MTVPQKFYKALNFGEEAEYVVRADELAIRSAYRNEGGEFAYTVRQYENRTVAIILAGTSEDFYQQLKTSAKSADI